MSQSANCEQSSGHPEPSRVSGTTMRHYQLRSTWSQSRTGSTRVSQSCSSPETALRFGESLKRSSVVMVKSSDLPSVRVSLQETLA